ncbi:MAG: type I-E CRISPR-associated protein Cse2/CasB [Gammaproteobacteria bacterium]
MPELPDFVAIAKRFENLTPGQKAELKRVAAPEDVAGIPAFYRLFPGDRPAPWCQRMAFVLPWAPKHVPGAQSLGRQLAKDVSEMRIYQVVRASSPNDFIQLRRLVQHIEPRLDWAKFGKTLYYWGDNAKRRLLEDFFIASSVISTD